MIASVRDPVPIGSSKKRRNELAHVTEKSKEKLQVWLDPNVHPVSLETFSVSPSFSRWLALHAQFAGPGSFRLSVFTLGYNRPYMALTGSSRIACPLRDHSTPPKG